jgi:hypothetical protein
MAFDRSASAEEVRVSLAEIAQWASVEASEDLRSVCVSGRRGELERCASALRRAGFDVGAWWESYANLGPRYKREAVGERCRVWLLTNER